MKVEDLTKYLPKPIDVSELRRLEVMLTKKQVPHEWIDEPEMGGASIKIPSLQAWREEKGTRVSVIQHFSSYGGRSGRLECWVKAKRKKDERPVGWLSADEVYTIIEKEIKHG